MSLHWDCDPGSHATDGAARAGTTAAAGMRADRITVGIAASDKSSPAELEGVTGAPRPLEIIRPHIDSPIR